MGRLFWKFFLVSWLTLLSISLAVRAVVWWQHRSLHSSALENRQLSTDHHATLWIEMVANILEYGGEGAIRDFLNKPHAGVMPPVFVMDDKDHDILNREISVDLLNQAKKLHRQRGNTQAIRQALSSTGHSYLLFMLNFPHRHTENASQPEWLPSSLSIVIGTIASLLLSIALACYVAIPIRNLRRACRLVANGKLDTRVASSMIRRKDELADLGHDFDDMTARLQNLMSAQQRLLHDVSHELRSPLARMQVAIGIAEQQPHRSAELLERIQRESQLISHLVGELLLLSKLEAGVKYGKSTCFDFNHVVEEVIDDARFEANQKDVTIHYQGIDQLWMTTYHELLRRAVENIVRNAVQHSSAHCQIWVNVSFTPPRLSITVTDQGSGVPEFYLKDIFQPFFKDHQQRKQDSIGLGLTISKRAIETLGGSVNARNRVEGGLVIEMTLPLDHNMVSSTID